MLSRDEKSRVLREMVSIATEAAALIMEGYRRPGGPGVEYKGAIDLVTQFDRASEERIRARAAESFPEFDLVAEEQGGHASGDRPVLYVDPLDGTTNYAHGHPFFAVSMGLVHQRMPEIGVIVSPALGWVHAGARGLGATRNGTPVHVSATDRFDRAFLATGFPYDRRTSPENNFREFVELKKRVQGVRRCGAASIDLALLAEGTFDGYWESKLYPWDLAGGAALVLAAGGRTTSFDGGPPDVTTGSLVATNGALHEALLNALAAARRLPRL